jgi:hypothetical protein
MNNLFNCPEINGIQERLLSGIYYEFTAKNKLKIIDLLFQDKKYTKRS